jgi:hypothetical protein
MVLGFLLMPQVHKVRNGYYLNHDNLMVLSPEERTRVIFYFIASQTPEKLFPSDRQRVAESR